MASGSRHGKRPVRDTRGRTRDTWDDDGIYGGGGLDDHFTGRENVFAAEARKSTRHHRRRFSVNDIDNAFSAFHFGDGVSGPSRTRTPPHVPTSGVERLRALAAEEERRLNALIYDAPRSRRSSRSLRQGFEDDIFMSGALNPREPSYLDTPPRRGMIGPRREWEWVGAPEDEPELSEGATRRRHQRLHDNYEYEDRYGGVHNTPGFRGALGGPYDNNDRRGGHGGNAHEGFGGGFGGVGGGAGRRF